MKETLVEGESLNKQGGSVRIGRGGGHSVYGHPLGKSFMRELGIQDYRQTEC